MIEGRRATLEGEEEREQMNKRGRDGECGRKNWRIRLESGKREETDENRNHYSPDLSSAVD